MLQQSRSRRIGLASEPGLEARGQNGSWPGATWACAWHCQLRTKSWDPPLQTFHELSLRPLLQESIGSLAGTLKKSVFKHNCLHANHHSTCAPCGFSPGFNPMAMTYVQAIQAKSPIAASIERDAIIHSQLHHPNIIGFKRVSYYLLLGTPNPASVKSWLCRCWPQTEPPKRTPCTASSLGLCRYSSQT